MKGPKTHPLYRWIADKKIHPKTGGAPKWNFQKFLTDHRGKIIARFSPRENPLGKKVVGAIDKALKTRGPWKPGKEAAEDAVKRAAKKAVEEAVRKAAERSAKKKSEAKN